MLSLYWTSRSIYNFLRMRESRSLWSTMVQSCCWKILPDFLKQNNASSESKCEQGSGSVHLGHLSVLPGFEESPTLPSIMLHLRLAPAFCKRFSRCYSSRSMIWCSVRCVIEMIFSSMSARWSSVPFSYFRCIDLLITANLSLHFGLPTLTISVAMWAAQIFLSS